MLPFSKPSSVMVDVLVVVVTTPIDAVVVVAEAVPFQLRMLIPSVVVVVVDIPPDSVVVVVVPVASKSPCIG